MSTNAVLVAGQAKLMRREEVAEGTMAFHFEKPSGFKFKAGQFADVTLTKPPETDAEGNTRTFSIASPPFENELVFTTRRRDTAFKRLLRKVPLAMEVKIGSAAGSFTLHQNPAKPARRPERAELGCSHRVICAQIQGNGGSSNSMRSRSG
jgi:ferredoxin-NADP reductase